MHKCLEETVLDLGVGIAKDILVELLVIALDGQVAGLEKDRNRVFRHDSGCGQRRGVDIVTVKVLESVMSVTDSFRKKRGGAALKPEIADSLVCKRIHQAVRIIDIFGFPGEMIPVVYLS